MFNLYLGDDFATDLDLEIACTILQKQIERIDGKKENIIIPKVAMNRIHERNSNLVNSSNENDVEMSSSSTSNTNETSVESSSSNAGNNSNTKPDTATKQTQQNNSNASPVNPCALCLTEEKSLALIPCGHVATCVSCGHSLRTCPICRTEINAFVRVYL